MAPLFMREISLTLDVRRPARPVEFKCDVHAATIEPEAGDVVTYVTLCPDGTYSQRAATTYVLHLVGVQNWDAAGPRPVPRRARRGRARHSSTRPTARWRRRRPQPAKAGTCIGRRRPTAASATPGPSTTSSSRLAATPETLTAPPAAMTAAPERRRPRRPRPLTVEEVLTTSELEDEVEDLADVALAHPVVHKRLDLARLNVREDLSLGDVEDMARELGTDPGRPQAVLAQARRRGRARRRHRPRLDNRPQGRPRPRPSTPCAGFGRSNSWASAKREPYARPGRGRRRSSGRAGSSRTRG